VSGTSTGAVSCYVEPESFVGGHWLLLRQETSFGAWIFEARTLDMLVDEGRTRHPHAPLEVPGGHGFERAGLICSSVMWGKADQGCDY